MTTTEILDGLEKALAGRDKEHDGESTAWWVTELRATAKQLEGDDDEE